MTKYERDVLIDRIDGLKEIIRGNMILGEYNYHTLRNMYDFLEDLEAITEQLGENHE